MGATPTFDYDWALIRLVPDVVRGDACTVGVVLHARQADFIGLRVRPDAESACGSVEPGLVRRYLDALLAVTAGGPEGGPIGLLTPSERFHWITSSRSTAIQPSPVHTGRSSDPAAALAALYDDLVAPPS